MAANNCISAATHWGYSPRMSKQPYWSELTAWQELAVEGHFKGQRPWLSYNDLLRGPMAELIGAKPQEVVVMNALTVNLHLMMISFYRPQGQRRKILIEQQSFPSDRYAVESQIRMHGLDPEECLVEIAPSGDGRIIEETAIEDLSCRTWRPGGTGTMAGCAIRQWSVF